MPSSFPTSIDSFTDPLSTSPLNSPSHSSQHANLNSAVNKIETYMGLVYISTTTFTGTSSIVAIDGCFTSTYTNYRILVDNMTSSASAVYLKLRASGTANSANYYSGGWLIDYAGNSSAQCRNNSTDGFYVSFTNGTAYPSGMNLDIKSPQKTERTTIGGSSLFWDSALSIGGYHGNVGSFDGFQLSGTANLTGTISVYGYRK